MCLETSPAWVPSLWWAKVLGVKEEPHLLVPLCPQAMGALPTLLASPKLFITWITNGVCGRLLLNWMMSTHLFVQLP